MGSGQYINPLHRVFLNLSGGTVSGDTVFTQNLAVSGSSTFNSLSATSLSGDTIYSGSTPLSTIITNSIPPVIWSGNL